MARFEGEAARQPYHLEHVAMLVKTGKFVTPTERKLVAESIDHGILAAKEVTDFLKTAPADEILACSCEGCGHLRDHLAGLRKVAHA